MTRTLKSHSTTLILLGNQVLELRCLTALYFESRQVECSRLTVDHTVYITQVEEIRQDLPWSFCLHSCSPGTYDDSNLIIVFVGECIYFSKIELLLL